MACGEEGDGGGGGGDEGIATTLYLHETMGLIEDQDDHRKQTADTSMKKPVGARPWGLSLALEWRRRHTAAGASPILAHNPSTIH